jgi:PII-like signaling protein
VVGEARIFVGFGHTTTIQTIRGSSDLLEGSKQIPVDVVVVDKAHQVVALLNLK